MKFKGLPLLAILIFIASGARAYNCSGGNKGRALQKTTVATPEENDYDIKGLKFNLSLSNTSTYVSGDVTTYARTNIANFSVYAFELNGVMTIDSLKVNGQLNSNISTTSAVRKVTLTTPLSANTDFTVQVFYHGTAPGGNGQFFTGGLHHIALPSGSHLMYSLSDDLFTDDWWPCKQSLQDKIDSVTMWVTVDDTLKVGSNGLLKNVTTLPGNKHRYEWETKYPVDYYLICVAVYGHYDRPLFQSVWQIPVSPGEIWPLHDHAIWRHGAPDYDIYGYTYYTYHTHCARAGAPVVGQLCNLR